MCILCVCSQYEPQVLEACLSLLQVSPQHLRDEQVDHLRRSDPVYLSRVVCAMVRTPLLVLSNPYRLLNDLSNPYLLLNDLSNPYLFLNDLSLILIILIVIRLSGGWVAGAAAQAGAPRLPFPEPH